MASPMKLACSLVVIALAGCQAHTENFIAPSPKEMRTALKQMLKDRPDIGIPEFQEAIDRDPAILRGDKVYIGPWNLYPELLSFEAVFSAPNITLYEIYGRFEQDPAGNWKAVPRRVNSTHNEEVKPYWRASDINPYQPSQSGSDQP